MYKLPNLQGAGNFNDLVMGAGDLYVTIYSGKTMLVCILLGSGLTIDESKALVFF